MDLYSSIRKFFTGIICITIINVFSIKSEILSPAVELYIGIVNSSQNITFTLTSESSVWGADDWDDDLLLTDSYNTSQYTADKDIENMDSWGGWHFATSTGSIYPVYGWGLYKICRNNTNDYFYLDFRDDRYGGYDEIGGYTGHWIDLWIKYDASSGYYSYSNDGSENWLPITSFELPHPILSIWEIKQMGNPTRDRFQPTNPTGLTATKVNNHPKLTWNESSAPPSVPKYNVYRSSESVYHCIASYLDTNTYTDDDVTFNKFGGTYHYKVRAVSGDSSVFSPGYSNIVTFLGDGPIEKKIVAEPVNEQPDYFPLKIFPNPFNRTVQIQFQLPSDKVYNTEIYSLSGHCVWDYSFTPQNGGYSFSWNGSDRNGNILPSGIYFLIVKSGNHSIFREKLMYLK